MTLTVEGIIRNHLNHIQNYACRFVKHTQEFNFARYLAACSSFKFGTRHRLHSSGSCPNKDRTVWKRNACFSHGDIGQTFTQMWKTHGLLRKLLIYKWLRNPTARMPVPDFSAQPLVRPYTAHAKRGDRGDGATGLGHGGWKIKGSWMDITRSPKKIETCVSRML
jgi:hypothetical protein